MRLTVSGLPPQSDPNHFRALFGRYVYGFKPWTHCDRCLQARQERQIHPKMETAYPLILKDDLFYLCAVGRSLSLDLHPESARKTTNVHLAVVPRKGSVAATGSVYGATFVIEDAQAIPITAPNKEFPELLKLEEPARTAHVRCKMFHFGYQMFDVDEISTMKSAPVHKLRREWLDLSGIKRDANSCMVDPRPAW